MSTEFDLPLPTRALLVHHAVNEARCALKGYYAIEQFLLCGDQTNEDDNNWRLVIDREDLRQLLIVLNTTLSEKLDFLEKHSKQVWRALAGEGAPDDPAGVRCEKRLATSEGAR